MKAVLFHLEDEGVFHFWYEPMLSFGLDTLLYVDRGQNPYDYPQTDEMAYTRFEEIREALKTYPRMHWVFFEPDYDIERQSSVTPISLHDFEHPKDDFIYVFGADRGWDEVWGINPKHAEYVFIPGISLRAVNAASMVLWDRQAKEQRAMLDGETLEALRRRQFAGG